ncbi:hypothetical protein EV121DRAFT_274916, partial [Schizophyllum commune]
LEGYKLRQMEQWKLSSGWAHKFIYFTFYTTYQGMDFVRYLRLNRIGQITEVDEPNTTPGPRDIAFSGPKPRTVGSVSHASDATAALLGTKEAGNLVTVDPYRGDTIVGKRNWPYGSQLLYSLEFPPENQPTILHLALVVGRIHSIGPHYKLLGTMCYWYARSVYEVMKAKSGGREKRSSNADKRGKSSVERCAAQGHEEGVPAQRAAWELIVGNLGQGFPDVFAMTNLPSSYTTTTTTTTTRARFIQPIEDLIGALDDMYAAKVQEIEDVDDTVKEAMERVRTEERAKLRDAVKEAAKEAA